MKNFVTRPNLDVGKPQIGTQQAQAHKYYRNFLLAIMAYV